jgi:hypothetical protein
VCNAFGHEKLYDSVQKTGSIKRYVNPKMERELLIFKKKILHRNSNKEISDNFIFPRRTVDLKNILTNQVSKAKIPSLKRIPSKEFVIAQSEEKGFA